MLPGRWACDRPRRAPGLSSVGAVITAVALCLAAPRPALAARHDLRLLNLCEHRTPAEGTLNGRVLDCSWVRRQPGGLISEVVPGEAGESSFRSLMSELGVVIAPRLVIPADGLGFGGFQISGEIGTTSINNGKSYWNGVEGVQVTNPQAVRPEPWLTTLGAFVRKGIWLGLPAFELGAGAVTVADSHLVAWQGYAKLGLHEGFSRWPLPSLAVRGGVSYLTGTDQARMTVTSFDVLASKGFGVQGTFRLEPFVAMSFLFIHASSGVVDATPSCDAAVVRSAGGMTPVGDHCADAQRGTENDKRANFAFSEQETITRTRYAVGAKVKFATVFLSAELQLIPGGSSRDGSKPNGARDGSGDQRAVSLSGGFDF
jgi:hypothetical protein